MGECGALRARLGRKSQWQRVNPQVESFSLSCLSVGVTQRVGMRVWHPLNSCSIAGEKASKTWIGVNSTSFQRSSNYGILLYTIVLDGQYLFELMLNCYYNGRLPTMPVVLRRISMNSQLPTRGSRPPSCFQPLHRSQVP